MYRGAYVFVAVVFLVLGASFVLSTASIVYEFRELDWPTLLIAHSHLFLFFPIFGLTALVAFYVPSVVFTDLYFRHIPYGRARFLFGMAVALGIAVFFANALSRGERRAIWEVSPVALAADAAASELCTAPGQPCRKPILGTLEGLRSEGLNRSTLSAFARNCKPDSLLERPEADRAARYCFPAGSKLDADACCRVQADFAGAVRERWRASETRSHAADWDVWLMPFKVFFIVVVIVIGIFLTIWRKKLTQHYPEHVPAIERGVVIGAVAMLFWPLMDYAYQQTSDVLFGKPGPGLPVRHSLVVLPWAVLLMFYFMERLGKDLERVAQFSTIMASTVAILRYQEINDWSARLFGSGADWWHFILLGTLALAGLVALAWPWRIPERRRKKNRQPLPGEQQSPYT